MKFYLDGAYNLDLLYTAPDLSVRYMVGEMDLVTLRSLKL